MYSSWGLFPEIKWQTGFIEYIDASESSPASQFAEHIADNFLIQHVNLPTFKKANKEVSNTLDLIFNLDSNRIMRLISTPPLGDVNQGH